MRKILALDPGPVRTAYLTLEGGKIHDFGIFDNEKLIDQMLAREDAYKPELWIEMIASYGMPVGAEVFETCVWIGRFIQCNQWEDHRVTRIKIKSHICHSGKATDANIRQALLDRWGPQGTKKAPGPTYGISKDVWAALAVATYALDHADELGRDAA